MNAKTLEAVRRHGLSLLAAFPNATEKDPVALCKKLRRIETATHQVMTDYCNGTATMEQADQSESKALQRLQKLLYGPTDKSSNGLIINRDPRGYALKLDDVWTREYNQSLNRIPKCAGCGSDALSCSSTDRFAHSKNINRKNINAIAEWRGRQSKCIYTDMGGYGLLAPDLTNP